MEKRTALFQDHKQAHAKTAPFGAWEMPIFYESVLKEHKHVREQVGLFDVSHMDEIFVTGPNALRFLNELTINDVSRLSPGQGQYSAICLESGGIIDDLIIYALAPQHYLICVNASNIEKDAQWLKEHSMSYDGVQVHDDSAHWSQIAVQGPKSLEALSSALPLHQTEITKLRYTHIAEISLWGHRSYVARTGYTGEKGYEIYLPHEVASPLWNALLKAPLKDAQVKPVGLGARDTLRLEACHLLYGSDIDEQTTPLEAGIAWAVRMNKGSFIGRSVLEKQKNTGIKNHLVAFKMKEEGIPRKGMTVYSGERPVGVVRSGSVLPTVGGSGGLAFVSSHVQLSESLSVDIRGQQKACVVVERPFYGAKVK